MCRNPKIGAVAIGQMGERGEFFSEGVRATSIVNRGDKA